MTDDDYYELLGVDRDAATEEIRNAYRDRKGALDNLSDGGKDEAARLNKAWNVLSDPYQRGRYDATRENDDISDDIEIVDDDDDLTKTNGKSSKRPPAPKRDAKGKRVLPPPTISTPSGTRYPAPKQRIIAMVIDLVVLVTFFIGAQFVAQAYAKSSKPDVVDKIDQMRKGVDADAKVQDNAKKALDTAKKAQPVNQADVDAKQKAYDSAKAKYDTDNKAYTKEQEEIQPIYNTVIGAFFFLGLLYLVIPAGITGRTLGKRFQHLKVLREDGSKLRWSDAIKRYGLLILVTYALSFLVGPLAAVIVLVGVTTWMRNPNQQGVHDRISKTIVVTDAPV